MKEEFYGKGQNHFFSELGLLSDVSVRPVCLCR